MIELLDHLTQEGESITTPEGIFLRVEDTDKNRINKLFLRLPKELLKEN